MGLRIAGEGDWEHVLSLCEEAYLNFNPAQTFSKERVLDFFDLPNSLVLLSYTEGKPTGILMSTVVEPQFSKDLTAVEVLWYSKKDNKKELVVLFKAYEYWAKRKGAKFIQTSSPFGDSKFFGNRKYKKINTDYIKEV